MDALIQDLKSYLQETLGIHPDLKSWQGACNLPLFLQNFYSLYTVTLLRKSALLVVAREDVLLSPALIRNHIDQLQVKSEMPCIYVSKDMTFYNRKRLMKHGVQFVIPKRQVYLPALGMDWQDRGRISQVHGEVSKLLPSTQAVVIYSLTHQNEKQFIPMELAKVLNYTPMTMTRALNELESVGLGKTVRMGKERRFSFTDNRSLLWEKAEPLMENPVKKRLWLKGGIKEIKRLGVIAGLSALAELSMLSLPKHPIYAMSSDAWKKLSKSGAVQELPTSEEADIELEVWNYDPKLFARIGVIDHFSLFLSLKEMQDERVEKELEKLIKDIKW